MIRNKTYNRKKILIIFSVVLLVLLLLAGRLVYLMVFCSEYYGKKAEDLHERERDIKAARGRLLMPLAQCLPQIAPSAPFL